MKTLLTLICVMALAGVAAAQETHCYGWEDSGVELGCYNCDNTTYLNDGTHTTDGSGALAATDLGGSTPQIFVAWIVGLTEGDEVTATADAWDNTVGTNPSIRLWAHYTDDVDINNYDGSTGEGSGYSGDTEWSVLSHTWTIPADKVALCIEARPYDSDPWPAVMPDNYNWMDNLCVTVPSGVYIYFPGGTIDTGADEATWGAVKAMFK